jgi:hypothetical protein
MYKPELSLSQPEILSHGLACRDDDLAYEERILSQP